MADDETHEVLQAKHEPRKCIISGKASDALVQLRQIRGW